MMRAIKIDPFSKTITEIDVTSSDELVTIIGSDRLVLTPLDRGINLLSGENDETKPSFGFYGLPDLVVYGVAAIVGGTMKLMRPLHEGLRSFELTVEWGEIA